MFGKFKTGNMRSADFGASPYLYGGEAATTTLNPEPNNLFP